LVAPPPVRLGHAVGGVDPGLVVAGAVGTLVAVVVGRTVAVADGAVDGLGEREAVAVWVGVGVGEACDPG
jgi:hypothetical protein